jgi:hypothetical protein
MFKPIEPLRRILRTMEDRVNGQTIVGGLVKNFEGKAPNQSAPKFIKDQRIHFRMPLDSLDASFDAAEKIFTQSKVLRFVPIVRVRHIGFGLRSKDDSTDHSPPARARSRTCSQVRPEPGSFTKRFLRRRNSSRFSREISSCPASAAKLSQRSSTSWRRSARPSLKIGSNSDFMLKEYGRGGDIQARFLSPGGLRDGWEFGTVSGR